MHLRILHIITGLQTGGAERSLVNLIGASPIEGGIHHVISLSGPGQFGTRLQERGIELHCLNLRGLGGLPFALLRLRKIIRSIAPDVVQGWMYHGNVVASLGTKLALPNVPVAWNIRQSLYDIRTEKRTTQWLIRVLRAISSHPQSIIYNSFVAREHHESFGFSKSRAVVISNGFDTNRWKPNADCYKALRLKLANGNETRIMGYVGRFHPQKDVPTFLAACALAMIKYPELHTVLVGDGLTADNRALSELIAHIPRERLHMLGRHDNIETIMPAFDFFCISSSSEAFPNVLGEAMACGLPCISTDVGDCTRLLDEAGKIVPVGDVRQLAQAIELWAGTPFGRLKQIGAAARKKIKNDYSLEATVSRYLLLYRSLTRK